MGARERANFELTLKGSEELSLRTYRLDAKARNILFLIQRGFATIEGILDNTIFPREEVVDRLRELLRGHFLVLHAVEAPPATLNTAMRGPVTASVPLPEPRETEQPPEPIYFGL
jgi:hypothetical protein